MDFGIKPTQKKVAGVYKSPYIERSFAEQTDRIAKGHETSLNNVVISVIEACLWEE